MLQATVAVSSANVESFRFSAPDYEPEATSRESLRVGDRAGAVLVLDEYSTAGKHEFSL